MRAPRERMNRALGRLLIVLAGIVVGQAVLYGPSLIGRKVLLPLDILAGPGVYIPRTPEVARLQIRDQILGDWVYMAEPARRFANAELRAGRLPMWAPYQFAGAPFLWPKFSPFLLLQYCAESPIVLAWAQLAGALVAGLGAYYFFRRVLALHFWPAAICSWCYPLTGFLIYWQGYPISLPVLWLPWMLLAVDKTVRGASPLAPVGLSAVTGLVLTSGQLDIAAQVLLAAALYAVWCFLHAYAKAWFCAQARKAVLVPAVSWGLGFLLAAPAILPLVEYARTGARMARRSAGKEERPPVGLAALPQIVLPDMYGTTQAGSYRLTEPNQIESSAATYTGAAATLLLAPLAWCSRRHRAVNLFWSLLAFLALSWCLNIPGLVGLLRLPGLNMLSHNRWVFVASFAILAMAAVGLEVVWQGPVPRRSWFWIPAGLLAALVAWSVYRASFLPEPLATQFEQSVREGHPVGWTRDVQGVRRMQAWFVRHYAAGAVWCGAGLMGWLLVWAASAGSGPRPAVSNGAQSSGPARNGRPLSTEPELPASVSTAGAGPAWRSALLPVFGVVAVADLLWFAYGRNVQCDPKLYFPAVPVLEQVAKAAPGRIIGYYCLPPTLAAVCGLCDVRGYDAVDPARLVEVLLLAADPRSFLSPYALTQWLRPKLTLTPEGDARLSPVLDMLNVRYVIFRGEPLPGSRPVFQGPDYWVLANPSALPRAFVPRRVEVVSDGGTRLQKLASPQFDPGEVAYVEAPIDLPPSCRGKAEIVDESPTRLTLSLRMETAGLVVLADRWDAGWQARLDGKRVPILPTNHALRGVVVPAGAATLEFRYQPGSFVWGLRLFALAAVLLLGWLGRIAWRRRRGRWLGEVDLDPKSQGK